MKALLQRVIEARVEVEEKIVGQISKGILVFLGVEKGDTEKELHYIVRKIAGLRIFYDDAGKMNLAVKDIGGEVLVVSQFTLAADCRKGNRPAFDNAETPEKAKTMYAQVIAGIRKEGITVASGEFAAVFVGIVKGGLRGEEVGVWVNG